MYDRAAGFLISAFFCTFGTWMIASGAFGRLFSVVRCASGPVATRLRTDSGIVMVITPLVVKRMDMLRPSVSEIARARPDLTLEHVRQLSLILAS